MQDKIQELTDRLYSEGLSKGQAEGARLLEEAKAKAAETVAAAKKEAEAIIAKAEKDAEDLKAKAESDIRMASAQALQATRKDIENVLVDGMSRQQVKDALSEPEFLKEIIRAVAEKFSTAESSDLSLVLPASLQDKLEPWVSSELGKALKGGVKASFTKKVAGGFTIGPADGSWFVSLTDETFGTLISEYLRPVTRKILFGE